MAETKLSRIEALESFFKRYSDVPREVIIKEDMQREGFIFTEAAVEKLSEGKNRKTYQLFSWDLSTNDEMEIKNAPVKLPDTIDISGGIYNLSKTCMRPRINRNGPYTVDVVEDKILVLDTTTREAIAAVEPPPPDPEWFGKTFEDGTRYEQIMTRTGDLIVMRTCQHWGKTEECKFCDINGNARMKKKLGQVESIAPKDPDQVAEVADCIFHDENYSTGFRPTHVHLNGGSVTSQLGGLTEKGFYLQYVRKIKERIGNRWPITMQSHPYTKEEEKYLREQGVNARMSNFEVWDHEIFKQICPGKEKLIGHQEWIRRILDQVDVFGEGNVCPGFVAGVEMAQPWGFKDYREAVKSTTEGLDFLMRHGVVPRPISWCVEALSDLAGQTPPPTEYFIELDRNWFELWDKYELPPVAGMGVGTGRNRYPNSASFDMARILKYSSTLEA